MATVKTPAKKTPAKKAAKKVVTLTPTKHIQVSQRTIASVKKDEMFAMPQEVKEWIDRASSTMKHQANQIAEMKKEIMELKVYKKFAANKIQGMSYE
jgi:hypothetical protein